MLTVLALAGSLVAADGREWICYCNVARGSPHEVVRADDNEQILLDCQQPKPIKDVFAKNRAKSQLYALADWHLIDIDGGSCRTAVPILNREMTEWLRRRASDEARIVNGAVREQLDRFVAATRTAGADPYVLLFSYVLDGLVWDHFEDAGALHQHSVSADRPHWNGVFWATEPARQGIGTNASVDGDYALKMAWTAAIFKRFPQLAQHDATTEQFIADLSKGKVTTDKKVIERYSPFGLVDAAGAAHVAAVVVDPNNALFAAATRLAQVVGSSVINSQFRADVRRRLALPTDEDALVIGYHELMWELLDTIERAGKVKRPRILSTPDTAPASDGAALFFSERRAQAPAAFARLKTLVGDWEAKTDKGGTVRATYRLVSNESTLVQTYVTPAGKETITTFHADGDRLLATHYCAQGNQPRLVLASSSTSDRLVFLFADATNLQQPSASHLARLELRLEGAGQYVASETYDADAGSDTTTLRFRRIR